MSKRLTKKEKGFADDYLTTENGTQAALKNYDTTDPNTAGVIAHENLSKPKIQEYLEEHAQGAISRIVTLSISAENETVRLNANKDIADRAGYKAIEKTVSLNVNANISDPRSQELANEYEEKLKKGL